MTEDGTYPAKISVETSDDSDAGSYTVSLQNEVTLTSGTLETFTPTSDDKVEFTIVVESVATLCAATSLNAVTITGSDASTPYTKYVRNGNTVQLTFTRPTTAIEVSRSESEYCGATTYEVFSDNDGTDTAFSDSWITISDSDLTIDFDSSAYSSASASKASITAYLKASLTDYTSVTLYTQIDIVICTVTTFTAPSTPNSIIYTIVASGTDTSTDNPLTISAWTQTDVDGATCAFTETLTFDPDLDTLAWLSATDRVVTADSSADQDLITTL